ncbi:hypothetical protein TNCT6_43030 [Streptomyces sp. 6-11-2]|nr:hypothetical protein TNCT6_43030 [Streptomyces sp. 6-11-2]
MRHGVPTTWVLIPVMRTVPASRLLDIDVAVRNFVRRSKCWRDSKEGVVRVSMGPTDNGFGETFDNSFDPAQNLHRGA